MRLLLLFLASVVSAVLDSALRLMGQCQLDTKFDAIRLWPLSSFNNDVNDLLVEQKKVVMVEVQDRYFEAEMK